MAGDGDGNIRYGPQRDGGTAYCRGAGSGPCAVRYPHARHGWLDIRRQAARDGAGQRGSAAQRLSGIRLRAGSHPAGREGIYLQADSL
ncbi:hypothetical protein D3C81_2032150 [compost metagenome]